MERMYLDAIDTAITTFMYHEPRASGLIIEMEVKEAIMALHKPILYELGTKLYDIYCEICDPSYEKPEGYQPNTFPTIHIVHAWNLINKWLADPLNNAEAVNDRIKELYAIIQKHLEGSTSVEGFNNIQRTYFKLEIVDRKLVIELTGYQRNDNTDSIMKVVGISILNLPEE